MTVKTSGYRGKVRKTARVFSNDPNDRIETLTIQAVISPAISVSSERVFLKGIVGETASGEVEIRAEREKPLTIEPVSSNLDQKADYKIDTLAPGKAYRIRFTSKAESPVNYHGILKLKTNYQERPFIVIQVRGRFQAKKTSG